MTIHTEVPMYSKFINYLKEKPSLYAPSSAPFWDDEHISEYMLKAHLDPEIDAASRRHDFIEQSAKWIAQYCNCLLYTSPSPRD